MNENENRVGEDITPEETDAQAYPETEILNDDIYESVTARDVFSHSKDQEIADAKVAMDAEETKEQAYEVYKGNPFDTRRNQTPIRVNRYHLTALSLQYGTICIGRYLSPYRQL